MRSVRSLIGSVVLTGALTLAGCASSGSDTAPDGAATPTPERSAIPAAAPTPGSNAVTDAETCSAIGDVMSIRFNADVAVSEGRMDTQEQGGWYRLATIVLSRVPTRGEGSVSDSVSALQSAVPPVALAAYGRGEIGSDDLDQQWSAVMQSCTEAGSEIATVAFTGG